MCESCRIENSCLEALIPKQYLPTSTVRTPPSPLNWDGQTDASSYWIENCLSHLIMLSVQQSSDPALYFTTTYNHNHNLSCTSSALAEGGVVSADRAPGTNRIPRSRSHGSGNVLRERLYSGQTSVTCQMSTTVNCQLSAVCLYVGQADGASDLPCNNNASGRSTIFSSNQVHSLLDEIVYKCALSWNLKSKTPWTTTELISFMGLTTYGGSFCQGLD